MKNGEEEFKKTHIHILFKVGENARYIKSIANEIGIPVNYLQGCNKKAMLMYLIHLNNPEKTQYDINEVQGELRGELAEILYDKEPENNKLAVIVKMIIERQITSVQELLIYGLETRNENIIRKYQYILMNCIKERKEQTTNRLLKKESVKI